MNRQGFICIWFDYENNRRKDLIFAENQLESIVDSFRMFDNLDQCINYIIKKQNKNIILITVQEDIIRNVDSFDQIYSIFILNPNLKHRKHSINNKSKKVQGIYSEIEMICEKIQETIVPLKVNVDGIVFVSSIDVNRQDPTFMYSQLLKDILLNDDLDEFEEETKDEMIEYCRQIYSTDQNILTILDEFEEHFLSELSIYWYSRESFLYKLINRALWTSEPSILYKLRYFLRQLHQQISTQSKLQYTKATTFIVYRGQNMSIEQVDKLKRNLGGFLSFNNFLSTSLKRQIALSFLSGSQIGVLFEIYVDTNIKQIPFANIEHLSFQQGIYNESEVLFSMGTLFRMVGMDTEKNFYRVQLMLTDDIDQQLQLYTKSTREKTYSTHSFVSLLKLMYELKQYNSVDCFARMFNEYEHSKIDEDLHGDIYDLFGLTSLHRGQFHDALEYFNKSLNICLNQSSDDQSKLATIYEHIGSVHLAQTNYETAVTHYELALECLMNCDDPDISLFIKCANNLATILFQVEQFTEALEIYQCLLEKQKELFGENDKSLTETYNIISIIYCKLDDYQQANLFHEKAVELQKYSSEIDPEAASQCAITSGLFCLSQQQYDQALDHFKCALHLQKQYFLPNNPELAVTYGFVADLYYEQHRYDRSLSNHFKVLDIHTNSLSDDHPSIGQTYFQISKDYLALESWSEALEFAFKAIEQIKKSSLMNIESLLSSIDHIALIYSKINKYKKALTFYQEALELCLNYLPDEDDLLIQRYQFIANTYSNLDKYDRALESYQNKLNLQLKISPDNIEHISTTYLDIATSYLHLDQFNDAFIAANQAQDCLLQSLPDDHPQIIKIRQTLDIIQRAM